MKDIYEGKKRSLEIKECKSDAQKNDSMRVEKGPLGETASIL